MKKLFVLCVLAGCLMGCGTTNSNAAQANVQQREMSVDKSALIESSIVEEKIEPVMLAEYPDIQDFGKTYGVAENEEKEELLKSMYPDAVKLKVQY